MTCSPRFSPREILQIFTRKKGDRRYIKNKLMACIRIY
jgi:hypothetical protein